MIHFAEPGWLLLFVIVIAMAAAAVWLARWRRRAREAFAGPQARHWASNATDWPQLGLVLLAASIIVIAAARPQWGSRQLMRERQGIDLVVALDVSQSMQATDASPSRLGLAQEELARLVEAQRGSRVGLVIFAGSAFLRSPLTSDTQAMSQIIRRADRDASFTTSGSSIGSALDQAGRILDRSDTPGKAILVVSDGEDFAGGFSDKVKALRTKGVVVFTAGTGTTQGSTLSEPDPRTRQPRPKLDSNGRPVVTRLDETNLRSIASEGGGSYVHLGTPGASLLGLRNELAQLEQTRLAEDSQKAWVERFQPFVIAALILLVESWLVPTRLFAPATKRLRRLRPHPGLAVVALALLLGACGGSGDTLRDHNAAANRLYEDGSYDKALTAYQALLAQRPDVPELSVNAGNAFHRVQRYDRAIAETQRALPPSTPELGAATYYNLGDHLLAAGQIEQAYDAFKNALLLSPGDADAKYNLELTLAAIRRRQQQQEQQTGSQPSAGQPQGGEPQQPGAQGQEGPPTPQTPSSQPAPPGQQQALSAAEATRQLQEALKGIDQTPTFEEALNVLDLLRQQQQTQRPGSQPQRGTGPDY